MEEGSWCEETGKKTWGREKKIVKGQRKARGETENQRSTSATPAAALTVTLTFGHSGCCSSCCKNQHAAKGGDAHP